MGHGWCGPIEFIVWLCLVILPNVRLLLQKKSNSWILPKSNTLSWMLFRINATLQINNNNNVITPMTMFIVLSVIMARLMQEFTRFIRWMQTKHQVAANPQTKPTDLDCDSACRLPSPTPTVTIYCYYSARGWYSFYHLTDSRRLSWPSWLATYHTEIVYSPADSHPSKYYQGPTQINYVIKTVALPLSQASTMAWLSGNASINWQLPTKHQLKSTARTVDFQ